MNDKLKTYIRLRKSFCFLLLVLSGLSIGFIACTNIQSSPEGDTIKKSKTPYEIYQYILEEELNFTKGYNPFRFIKLKNSNPTVSQIDKIIFKGEYIFILDQDGQQLVFAFDTTGNFLGIVGQKGLGPDEYEYPEDISVNDNYLIIATSDKNLLWYNLENLKLSKNTALPCFVEGVFPNPSGGWFVSTNLLLDNPYNTHLLQLDEEGKPIGGLIAIEKEHLTEFSSNSLYPDSDHSILFAPTHSEILYAIKDNNADTILSLNPAGKLGNTLAYHKPKFMNAPIISTSKHLFFTTFYSENTNEENNNKLYANIYNKYTRTLTCYQNTTVDWLALGILTDPIAVIQDSLLIWPLYADGLEAHKELYTDKNQPWQKVYISDKLASEILLKNTEMDNPTLLIGTFK